MVNPRERTRMVEKAARLATNFRVLWGLIFGLLMGAGGLWVSGWTARSRLEAQIRLPELVESNTNLIRSNGSLIDRNRFAIDSLRIARDSIYGQLKDIRCVVIAIARDDNATLTCGLRGQ